MTETFEIGQQVHDEQGHVFFVEAIMPRMGGVQVTDATGARFIFTFEQVH